MSYPPASDDPTIAGRSSPRSGSFFRRINREKAQVIVGDVIGRRGASVVEAVQYEAHPDPPSDDYVLQVLVEGALVDAAVDLGAGRFRFPGWQGAAAVSPPDVDCDYTSRKTESPFRLRLIGLPQDMIRNLREELLGTTEGDLGPLHASAFFDPTVNELCKRLVTEVNAGSPLGVLYADHLLLALTRSLLRRAGYLTALPQPSRKLDIGRMKTLVDVMQARLAEPIDLDDLASAVNMGRYELARGFKAAMGISPWQYFVALRCERAAELMARHGDQASLAYVAIECGFHDQSHMNRHFKRHIGLTPGAFQRRLSGSQR